MSSSRWLTWLLAALTGTLAGMAVAGSLAVSPLRLDIRPGQQMTAVTVTNSGLEPILVQAGVKRWQQQGGIDRYDSDGSLLVTPALFRLAPGGRQLVRVGWRRQTTAPEREQAWRLFLDELPATDVAQEPGLHVNLRIGIPLFALPVATQDIAWHAERDATGNPQLRLDGNVHARIIRLRLLDADQGVLSDSSQLRYVLPGNVLSWPAGPTAPRHAEVTTDAGRHVIDLAQH